MEGTGQFRPLAGSNPFIGKKHQVEYVKETRIEVLVTEDKINQVVKSVQRKPPYEVPAYYIYKHFQLPESLSFRRPNRLFHQVKFLSAKFDR